MVPGPPDDPSRRGHRDASRPDPPRIRKHLETEQRLKARKSRQTGELRTSRPSPPGCRMRAGPRRHAAADPKPAGREPAVGAAAPSRRADPGPKAVPDQAGPSRLAVRPRGPAPGDGTGDRSAEAPGARSVAGAGGQAWVRRSPSSRSRGPRSWGRRCLLRHSAGRRRPGWVWAAESAQAAGACAHGPAGRSRAGAAYPRVAEAAGRTRRLRPHPARSGLGCRPAGRRGDRPGAFAWAGHRRCGPGRRRRVPPGTSWTVLSSRAAGIPYPEECRSGEIPCRTWTTNCHQLHIIGRY